MAASYNGSEPEKCAVCLGEYQNPKSLPCFHTFCAQCISGLAQRSRDGYTFLCPSCRKPTSLPRGGVGALQTNFYINNAAPKNSKNPPTSIVKKGTSCQTHDDKILEFFCIRCDKPICVNCKLTEHEQHTTVDLRKAVERKKGELAPEKTRLQRAVASMKQRVAETKEEQRAVRDKKAAVLKNIEDRYAILVAAAEKFRDEALKSLHAVSRNIEGPIAKDLREQEENLSALLSIQQRFEQASASSSSNGTEIFTVARELMSGRASEESVRRMTSQELSVIRRPVLHFKITGDVMLQKARDFFGTVSESIIEVAQSEVRMVKQFQCGYSTDIEVFSLCHVDHDYPRLWVSYERRMLQDGIIAEIFGEDGKCEPGGKYVGKTSWKRYAKGKMIYLDQRQGRIDTFCKSLTAPFYKLENDLSGKARIKSVTISRGLPPSTQTLTEFSVKVGPHRAFDVDETGQFFVVVEEAQCPDMWRKVKLYCKPGPEPVSTYTPPKEPFQPSDVCFYRLNGEQVLLVTDELNDCIHVVNSQPGRLSKVPLLAPGCAPLIQPTAITVDVSGRLWLACRGGTILCLEPAYR